MSIFTRSCLDMCVDNRLSQNLQARSLMIDWRVWGGCAPMAVLKSSSFVQLLVALTSIVQQSQLDSRVEY